MEQKIDIEKLEYLRRRQDCDRRNGALEDQNGSKIAQHVDHDVAVEFADLVETRVVLNRTEEGLVMDEKACLDLKQEQCKRRNGRHVRKKARTVVVGEEYHGTGGGLVENLPRVIQLALKIHF